MKSGRYSFFAFIFCCAFITSVCFYIEKWNEWQSQKLIGWDISGYYMYLPGLFYTDDLGKLENRQYVIDTYHPCGNDFYAYPCEKGNHIIKYSSGMAIMYLPGFIAGHIYAKLGNYPVDGFSYPFQFCMAMYSLLISFLGLWMFRKVLLLYFKDSTVALVLLTLCVASNYLNYSAIANMFSHNYLFTLYSILIFLTIQWYKKADYKKSILLGLLCGLATLTRPTEFICVLIPATWGLGSFDALKDRFKLLVREYRKLIAFGVAAILVGSVQLLYWKVYTGHFTYWSYGPEEGFNFLRVPVYNCLIGYKKGWFTYTPVMVLSFLGFIPLIKYHRSVFYAVLITAFLALYITFSWKCWWYGGSFSLRAVIQYYAILFFPVCAFFTWAQTRLITLIPTLLFLVFCAWLNLVMTYQANGGGIMESDNMSKTYFWKIFGKLSMDPNDRKFVETDEEIPSKHISGLINITNHVFCTDSSEENCINWEKEKVFKVTKAVEFLPETKVDVSHKRGEWFRISSEVYQQRGEDRYDNKPMFCAWLIDSSNNTLKQKGYRVERVLTWNKWQTVSLDIYVPENLEVKYLKGGIYNPGGDVELLIKNVKIESTDIRK